MRKALLFLLLTFTAAPAVMAQVSRFEVTPIAGYRFNGEVNVADDDLFDEDAEIDEGTALGVLVDIPLSENWQLELLANRQESSFIVDEGLLSPTVELGDVRLEYLHAGILYQWGLGQVLPFITFSGGVARIRPEFDDLDAENRLSASLGGGVKIFFNRNVGVRLEGRGYWTDLGSDDDDRRGRRRYDDDDGLYQGEASAGLIFAW